MVDHLDSSDLGRRVRLRRRELGLTRQQLALRTGIDLGYLEYLEDMPAAGFDTAALLRLADGLQTTAEKLLGGGLDQPPGAGPPGAEPLLEPLDRSECFQLLRSGGVGRLVFDGEQGPAAVPVNFKMLEEDVVFRTSEGTAKNAESGTVGFEVDHIDDGLRQGWSVLIGGRAHRVTQREELSQVGQSKVEPWAGGQRAIYVRLVPSTISGRRIQVAPSFVSDDQHA
jgi:nitroimidazol reductase NimA-like FMN-containing flavoprotein (pyridoxamine 5'-phosphate oxidase superfamily)